jgi:hypothetical protein
MSRELSLVTSLAFSKKYLEAVQMSLKGRRGFDVKALPEFYDV